VNNANIFLTTNRGLQIWQYILVNTPVQQAELHGKMLPWYWLQVYRSRTYTTKKN